VQTYLKDFDYWIEFALNGVEGLQKLKEFKPEDRPPVNIIFQSYHAIDIFSVYSGYDFRGGFDICLGYS
jgi:hypothetical protein